ncbi:major facilitator superfamily domain-containing protein [Emericellopsis atlantica]|uniref:Major facilitator superfamily domain-containing protein n=1 Tax=Emericellopsis atlantica TaxID=2614577 RepID=A0A9P8CPQ2_9HYPO|nr:major facilitator superfamily domain-containing protein [Emericellopsis atlantica]KAG9255104.1 major facilitator superfamily domain-containing protein [Emericellopsis atlantica]
MVTVRKTEPSKASCIVPFAMSNDDKEMAGDQLESKWQSRHVDEREIPVEQRKAEARLLRKVDWRLIPILGILYSIAGLDRVNLSNARVAGMDSDLHFDVGDRYSIALLIFFVTYFLFEMPTTLILRWAGPKLLLNSLVFSWGCVMLGMGFANDWRVIVVCRMLIGILEAGFLPCCMYLLSSWYQRYEVQQRMALWYMINLFVSAFGNILAYALIKLDGAHGIEGWRWIFIIEGAITIGFAFLGYAFTLPFPDQLLASGKKSTFSQDDLQTILDRVERDRGDAEPDALTFRKVLHHAARWELWVYGFMFLCCSAPIYAFAYFIQIILTTLGYGTAKVFLLCAPPYLFSIIWTLAVAWCADRSRLRMPWMVLNAAITLTGLLLTAYHGNNAVRYFGVFLGVSGCNGNLPTIIAFQSNNVRGDSRRSVASGVQMLFASLGGVYASCTFMQTEYPTYRTGVWCAVATQFLLIVLVGLMWWWFKRQNKKAETQGVIIQEDADYRYTF